MSEKMLTPEDAAERLQVKVSTIRRWLRNGAMKGVKIGQLWRISETTIEEYEKAAQGSSFKQNGGKE